MAQEKVPVIPISNLTYQQFVESLSARMSAWCELNPKSQMLLVIDQVEELITLCRDDQERKNFLNFLAKAVNDYPEQLRLVLTLRLDFESQLRDTGLERYWGPAHDALVQGWPKLLIWKKQQQENLILQRRLTPAAEEWKSRQQARFLWHDDPRLGLLKQVFKSTDNWFNKVEAEFVRSSVRQKRKNVVGRWSLVTGALVVLSIATVIAIKQSRDALKQTLETLSASAEVLLVSNSQLEALVEGVKAGELLKKNAFWVGEDTHIRVVTTLLWRRNGEPLQTLPRQQDRVFNVSFCRSDERTLISAGDDTTKPWRLQPNGTSKLRQSIKDKGITTAVSLSPDCRTIATASIASIKNFTLRLWRSDGKFIRTFFSRHKDQVRGLDFSPDGQTLASASWDKTISLWRIKDGKPLRTIPAHTELFGVRFVARKNITPKFPRTH